MAHLRTYFDGVEVTSLVQEGSCTHQANRPTFWTVRVDSDQLANDETTRCKLVLDGTIDAHGICVSIEDQADETRMSSTFTFADPSVLFEMRPARDSTGDFSKPQFMTTNTTGPAAIKEILLRSLNGSNPALGEGPMGLILGSFATGGPDLRAQPADWPKTIAEIIGLYVDTGEVDIVVTPIDSGGNMGQVDVYNGDYGQDLSGSVSFEYGIGAKNCRGARRSVDLSGLCNKLWIYGGPRVGTETDPQGDQHWAFNVTGTSSLPDPPMSTILAARTASQSAYFVRMAIRIFDGDSRQAIKLYQRWWQIESWIRLKPQKMIYMSPDPGIVPAFKCLDKIHVGATGKLRGGWSGTQRVMEYTYRWDSEGTVELGEPIGKPGIPSLHVSDTMENP